MRGDYGTSSTMTLKSDLTELKSLASPPVIVATVMGAFGVAFGSKSDWKSVKKLLANVQILNQNYKKCMLRIMTRMIRTV